MSALQRAFNLSLFNSPRAGDYFEQLVQAIDPMWSFREYRAQVVDSWPETQDTRTWVLRTDNRWPGFEAGQHVHVTLEIRGVRHTRTFSLSSAPERWAAEGVVTLTVKRVPDGRVTGWMHDHLKPGQVVSLSRATGDFRLPHPLHERIVWFAAGSGITPVASHLQALARQDMPVPATLMYFARTPEDFIMARPLQALAERYPRFHLHMIAESAPVPVYGKGLPHGRVADAHLDKAMALSPGRVYVCGPEPFRARVREGLLARGLPEASLVEERFGIAPVARALDAPVRVRFSASQREIETRETASLLTLAEQAGLNPTAGCRMGICHTCKCTKQQGQVRNLLTGELSGYGEEEIQICISTPVTPVDLAL